MTCETVYQMAGEYLLQSRAALLKKTTTREETVDRPEDVLLGSSGGVTTGQSRTEEGSEAHIPQEREILPLLSGVVIALTPLASSYAAGLGLSGPPEVPAEITSLADPFPLPTALAPIAALWLAALLLLPLDRQGAQDLRQAALAREDELRSQIPGTPGKIKQVYGT